MEADDLELRNLLPPRTALQACKNTHLWGADNQTQGLGHARQGFSQSSCVPSLKSTVLSFHVHLSPREDLLALRLPILMTSKGSDLAGLGETVEFLFSADLRC